MYKIAPETKKRAEKAPTIGQGLGLTRWICVSFLSL
tara:strand:+ start:149 stop:256 length:108 start_codon:yes stop_codon:yes gene_type:complete